ncbi:Sister chromatid cohesion 1 protein 3 [Sesamum angolense]|uniref:Sister chromatid cohesion 1 protein 3 n=1 Tax=Sesamum angolense TaxID=2727404 RepID=A0AAE1XGZ0_9LAMI|nr:Sister chromatid cohesion 1 protein 3 [Sesamum angolense]
MSGHLLLGVVRIYSKQVDYLYEDCNGVRNTINRVFTSVNVNLPDDATHAPFHAITLPEKFELDSLELDDYDKDLCEDSHLKSKDEITLSEQIPTGQDEYIVIRVDEYDFRASSFIEDDSRSGPVPMVEDIPPPVEVDATAGSEYPSPPNKLAADDGNIGNSSPQDLPSIEIMRDARHGFEFNNSPILPDRVEPDKFLEEQINKDKDLHSSYRRRCCPALLSLYEEGNISVHHMVTTEKTPQETSVDQALSPSHDSDREIEVLRNNEGASPDRFMPSFSKAVPSPHGRSFFTPENSSLGLQSERLETTEGDGALPTSDMGTSPRDLDSEMRTPDTFYGKGLPERTALSDIPELVSSAEDLGFLEQDDNSPAGSQGTPEFGIFSYNQGTQNCKHYHQEQGKSYAPMSLNNFMPVVVPTWVASNYPRAQRRLQPTSQTLFDLFCRAVAQYLKKQSSITPTSGNSEESSEDLSLNKILEGKPKKICARMFYETLVLKNYGLVDVHQENPYDNISLKVTPKLSKGQFSS